MLNTGELDSGWKKGENDENRNLGTKSQPRRTIEVDALLKWMPDLLGRCRAADSWPDPDRHPHVPAVLLRTVAPLLEAVAEALDGKPDRLQHLHNQIVSTGNRRARTIRTRPSDPPATGGSHDRMAPERQHHRHAGQALRSR